MTSHLHFAHCHGKCYGHGKIHQEYSITYDKKVSLDKDAIHIGSLLQQTLALDDKLQKEYHKLLLPFGLEHAENLPDNRGCDYRIVLITSKDKLHMGRIYRFSVEEEKILVEYLEKTIKEGNIWPSSNAVGSLMLFIPKPNARG